jgi:uncharacterized YccA/Bax inhibitor family protein
MRFVVLGTVAVVLTVCSLTGCSARDDAASAPTTSPSTTAQSTLPVVKDSTGLVELRWKAVSSVESGDLKVSVENDDCVDPKGVTVSETLRTVTVTAWGKKQQEPCAAVGYALLGSLPLHAPLGDRELRHGD